MMKTVSWNGTNISGDDTLCEQLLMTHSILKQFFFSVDVINHVSVTFSLAIFLLFLFAITFFQHFKCILYFMI